MKINTDAKVVHKRANIADSIDMSAKKIAESMNKQKGIDDWGQQRIEVLKTCDGKVGEIPIGLIKTHQNVRHHINENDKEYLELIESIRTHGILQPPIVTIVTNEHGINSILLVGGERRLRAAKSLGYEKINCLVRIFDEKKTQLTASMAENMNRQDLDPLDIANCFYSLHKLGYKYSELEKLFGKNERTIGRYVKIAKWPSNIHEIIRDNLTLFTTKYLFSLSSKRLSDEEILKEIQQRVGGNRTNKDVLSKQAILQKKLDEYFAARSFSITNQQLILEVLSDLGLINVQPDTVSPLLEREYA